MNDKTVDKKSQTMKILLVVLSAIYVAFPTSAALESLMNYYGGWENVIRWGVPLILLLATFFLVKKYPIFVGVLYLGIGLLSLAIFAISFASSIHSYEQIMYGSCIPPSALPMLTGYKFLQSGLLQRSNKGNEVMN